MGRKAAERPPRQTRGTAAKKDIQDGDLNKNPSLPEKAKMVESSLKLKVCFSKGLGGNVCRLHPSSFRKLSADVGDIMRVSSEVGEDKLYLEAFISNSISSDTVEVSSDLSHLIIGLSIDISKLLVKRLPRLQAVNISLMLLNPTGTNEPIRSSAGLQWKSFFRHSFFHTILYKNMRATLRTSLFTLIADVEEVTPSEDEDCSEAPCPYGLLTSETTLTVASLQPELLSSKEVSTEPQSCFTSGSLRETNHKLVLGEEGTGKTYTLHKEVLQHKESGRRILYLDVEALGRAEEDTIRSRITLHELFQDAIVQAPSTVVIDDLHLICSESSSLVGTAWVKNLLSRGLVEEMQAIRAAQADVVILASAVSLTDLHSSLVSPHALGPFVHQLEPPAEVSEKVACLSQCLQDVTGASVEEVRSMELSDVVKCTNGYTQRDFKRLVELAATSSFQKTCSLSCTTEELIRCARLLQPSSLRQFEVSVPNVTWSDIGGSEEAKLTLQQVVKWALGEEREVFEMFHLSPPRGVLLYGPPGCSKTMLAKALANESHLNFISVKGPEVFSKWVGDSEKAVRNIFARARAASPCVVFIDELDGMCGHRGQGGVSDRVISQFLTELDGLPSAMSKKKNEHSIVFVAATNRPDNIDGAVLRPGRIDKLVYVGLPGSEERSSIVSIQLKRIPAATDVSPDWVASLTEGYSGAEVVAVIKEAAFHALAQTIEAEQLTRENIMASLQKIRPRTRPEDVAWYLQWRHQRQS